MKIQPVIILYTLLIFISFVSGKGGGKGGGGGGSSGKSSGGGSEGSGGSGISGGTSGGASPGRSGGISVPAYKGTNKGSGNGLSAKNPGTFSNYGSYQFPYSSTGWNKGGYGAFTTPPYYQFANTRSRYTNYPSTYNGGYGMNGYHSGYVGAYNPALVYWALVPTTVALGYWYTYHRYNQESGAYFAPELSYLGSGSSSVQINGTEYSSRTDNYHTMFAISTSQGAPVVDHAYFATSDPSVVAADFVYRLTFANIIEYDTTVLYPFDTSYNNVTSLAAAKWDPIVVTNKTAPANITQTYLEATTVARNVLYGGVGPGFDVYLTWRISNLQINLTDALPLQPNSLQYNITLVNYPPPTSATKGIGIHQVIAYSDGLPSYDIGYFASDSDINAIKTNVSYGLSLGNYHAGRVEYQPSVNLTTIYPSPIYNIYEPAYSTNITDPVWNTDSVIITRSTENVVASKAHPVGSTRFELVGFGFLDSDVMNAMAEYYTNGSPSLFPTTVYSQLLVALCTILGIYAIHL